MFVHHKISVVIPLFNKEKLIKRTIKSVLSQTYTNFELIVVDDGSVDNSLKVASSFNDERVKVITKTNGGVSEARNVGIKEANYDFLAFLDADDIWDELFLEEINTLINQFPKASTFGTGYKFARKDGSNIIPTNIKYLKEKSNRIIDDYFKLALNQPLLTASSIAIQKNVFEEIGLFKVNLNRGEDLEMWSRIALNYEIAFSPKILATYFDDISERNKSNSLIVEKTFSYYAKKIYEKNKHKSNATKYFKKYILKKNLSNSLNYIRIKDKKSAINALIPFNFYYLIDSRFWKNIILFFLS